MLGQSNWVKTAAGTNAGATATQAADENRGWVVQCVSGHVDADSVIQVTDGTTVLWESKVDVSLEGFSFHFPNMNIPVGRGNAALGIIASSTADCQITIMGDSAP